jgi:hypothetical protein
MGTRLRWILFGCAVAACVAGLLLWRYAGPDAATALRPSPEIPILTRAGFDAATDEELLQAVQAEGTRRILAAGQGWSAGRAVLTPELRHLWTIAIMEADLHQSGFLHVQRLSAGPSPMLPPLADLAEAYRVVGQVALATVVDAALAAQDQEQGLAACDAEFRKVITEKGLRAQRVAYARQWRAAILDGAGR